MIFELFQWWYGAGLKKTAKNTAELTIRISRTFSVPILLRTLFSPWRKISSLGAKTLEDKVRASVDNLVSRFVGFTTRFLVLIAATLMMGLVAVSGILLTIIWPFTPLLIVYFIIRSITG
jgi:hypothetical protein